MENKIKELINHVYETDEKIGRAGIKLLSICLMLEEVDWRNVDKFALKWETVRAGLNGTQWMPVPVVYLTMKDGKTKSLVGDEEELEQESQS